MAPAVVALVVGVTLLVVAWQEPLGSQRGEYLTALSTAFSSIAFGLGILAAVIIRFRHSHPRPVGDKRS
ncbi:hypothetical protein [Frondihabitans australicus]|uniref:hypothetical protein n=1 Tax=Frondihabitans australicus TaxID=386892 RepID=UPI0011C3A919|nr:hypothetical protein [Frondihabitans australicus]